MIYTGRCPYTVLRLFSHIYNYFFQFFMIFLNRISFLTIAFL